MLTAEELAQLLGRPLTSNETANRELYLDIAKETLEDLLCFELTPYDASGDGTAWKFQSRDGYQTLFLPAFTGQPESVKINDVGVDSSKYEAQQFDNLNGSWFNSLVFKDRRHGEVIEVTAHWGFETLPHDLALLLARLFDLNSKQQKNVSNVASKQIEDFRITFRTDSTLMQQFVEDNARAIAKYSLCGIGAVQHGNVCIRPIRFY